MLHEDRGAVIECLVARTLRQVFIIVVVIILRPCRVCGRDTVVVVLVS